MECEQLSNSETASSKKVKTGSQSAHAEWSILITLGLY